MREVGPAFPLRSLWGFHMLIVVALTAVLVVAIATTPPDSGANIGAGLIGVALLALGLPWSLPVLLEPYRFDGLSDATHFVIAFGPAFLNVALHAAVLVCAGRRDE